jgi:6-phosphogluconolactonase
MNIEVLADAGAVAQRGAALIVEDARRAAAVRGRCFIALSGGRTPWAMLRLLAEEDVPWKKVHLFQVDERVAPAGDPDRNLAHLRASLLDRIPLPPEQMHAMPVDSPDLVAAAARYAHDLEATAGLPPVLDLVHLGLGADGHTASLVPGDPVLEVTNEDVALTRAYFGGIRMTLTYRILARARRILWLVSGAEKAAMLARLLSGDRSIPAGRVCTGNALILADRTAATGHQASSMFA